MGNFNFCAVSEYFFDSDTAQKLKFPITDSKFRFNTLQCESNDRCL